MIRRILVICVLLACCLGSVSAQGSLEPVLDQILDAPTLRGGVIGAILNSGGLNPARRANEL